ncbi:hexosaminidase [Soonwooa buanensis]|uniref:beta-N-acetylhexosaminidase n=1 Tax=Soonwooa buanensis TaxID=619805 RepID=A0A1T5F1Y4_9FLAO|nr:family 20 glycosylhydrolase [Soonwooa buanensis]SKB90058.1 hexosaminidase [Soonwooa buanensis]
MKKILLSVVVLFLSSQIMAQNQFIPKPKEVKVNDGFLQLSNDFVIQSIDSNSEADYLKNQLKKNIGKDFKIGKSGKIRLAVLRIKEPSDKMAESYRLKIDKNGISITAYTNIGVFRGVQTLLQLIEEYQSDLKLPFLEISDAPKFAYRGMHLDVCRHFFTVEEVKKYLDYLAMYKYNKFHWHLTDDQGWRIEIKKYPKLTSVGAWRNGSQVGAYSDMKFDDKKYGGFYTQEQIKDVVKYAEKLHIDVIPEIEMPGHAQAALAAYPELGCTKGPHEVWKQWGVSEEIFCPKEETFKFLENVLDEVMPLFPYQYIHIGGDEAPKIRWKQSEFCQNLIKKLNLKDELGLQSYFITRMEKYINSKGKKIIGWDEILEGGLAPNATVMSWTGIQGGIHAAKTGHKAIMTPTSTNYFDYYQGSPDTEPIAIGGDVTLKKVYNYNPIPSELSEEEGEFIWGTQGNLWTEYILDFKHVEYMIFPRMMALSEVAWGTSNPSEYKEFENRVIQHFNILDKKGINYSKAIFEVNGNVSVSSHGKVFYDLSSAKDPKNIRYTTDGTEPTNASNVYKDILEIYKTGTIKSAYFENGQRLSPITTQNFNFSKSTGKFIELENSPAEAYSTGGKNTLVDGVLGNTKNYGKNWLGFNGTDVVATIDFDDEAEFSNLKFNTLDRQGSWIYLPKSVTISVSNDGKTFTEIKKVSQDDIIESKGIMDISFPKQKKTYIKISIQNYGLIPDGQAGAGNKAWLFVDELSVN